MRWKTTVKVIDGISVAPGSEVPKSGRVYNKLHSIIDAKNPDFIMTDTEERKHIKELSEKTPKVPDNKDKEKGGEK